MTSSSKHALNPPTRLTRRGFLYGLGATVGAVALGGCGDGDSGSASPAPAPDAKALLPDKGKITLLTWEGYQDKSWLADYKTKTGVEVTTVTAGSVDEMFAKAKTSSGRLDVAYFDLGSVPRYVDAGLLTPVDKTTVGNVSNIAGGLPWEKELTIGGKLWGLPYNWGTQPLMWSAAAFPTPPTSWQVLWDPQYAGKVTMPDDSYVGFPMVALANGIKNPYNLSDQDFDTIRESLKKLRPQLKTLTAGFNDAVNLYASGDCVVGYCQNVAVVNELTGKGKDFAYGYPREGTPFWIDNSILLKGGNRKEVYDFINHTLTPQWQGDFIESSGNAGVIDYPAAQQEVSSAKLAQTEVKNLAGKDFWSTMSPMAPPNRMDDRLSLWNEFKAGL